MNLTKEISSVVNTTWHQDAAGKSIERWQDLLKQENWSMSDQALILMTRLFGASWYFTRFCFYRGDQIIPLFDEANQNTEYVEKSLKKQSQFSVDGSLDDMIEELRISKNEIMLSILLLQIGEVIEQEEAEALLSQLAENVLSVMYRMFELDRLETIQCIVLAMGRFAGQEMNYGSDLDLIFIEKVTDPKSDEHITNKIRKMLRYISVMDPSGALYEIDMRLRPHGSSGVLVTPLDSFFEFHEGDREIWERQMMTRCRVVVGSKELSEEVNHEILDDVYGKYESSFLATEIMKIRLLVEQELAGGENKYDIKRGKGGIMDIDFLTHYLQLAHGKEHASLRINSTREVLRESEKIGLLNNKTTSELLSAYDFYKKSELALRVFDMKSISKIVRDTKSMLPIARAMGYQDVNHDAEVEKYEAELVDKRNCVRDIFESIINTAI